MPNKARLDCAGGARGGGGSGSLAGAQRRYTMSELALAYAPLAQEIVLVCGAMALLMLGVMRPETEREAERICWLAIAVIAVAIWLLLGQLPG